MSYLIGEVRRFHRSISRTRLPFVNCSVNLLLGHRINIRREKETDIEDLKHIGQLITQKVVTLLPLLEASITNFWLTTQMKSREKRDMRCYTRIITSQVNVYALKSGEASDVIYVIYVSIMWKSFDCLLFFFPFDQFDLVQCLCQSLYNLSAVAPGSEDYH